MYIQVFTTIDNKAKADKIAEVLVKNRLAACVQIIGPIKSTYIWKGKMEKAEEWLCIIKTRADLYNELEKTILAIHPYETPEIIAIEITSGYTGYLKWIDEVCRRK